MKLNQIMVHGNIWMDITKALAYRSGSLPSLNSHHSASLACTSYTELKFCIIIVMLAFWYNNTVIFPFPCHEYPLDLQSSSVTYDNYTVLAYIYTAIFLASMILYSLGLQSSSVILHTVLAFIYTAMFKFSCRLGLQSSSEGLALPLLRQTHPWSPLSWHQHDKTPSPYRQAQLTVGLCTLSQNYSIPQFSFTLLIIPSLFPKE